MCLDHLIKKYVPNEEISDILQYCHTAAYGGHFGGHKTTTKVLQPGYYWLSIFKDSYEFVKCCNRCQRAGNISQKHEILLANILEEELFDVWGINFMGPFPPSFNNLYMVYYVSNWVETVALLINDVKVVVNFHQKNIFSRFRTPRAIISDEGTHFCNRTSLQHWPSMQLSKRLLQHIIRKQVDMQRHLIGR